MGKKERMEPPGLIKTRKLLNLKRDKEINKFWGFKNTFNFL